MRIFVSGGLDEYDIAELVAAGAPIDAFGVGTRMGVSADAPFVDSVYKLRIRRPAGPEALAGEGHRPRRKQAWRGPDGRRALAP